MKWNVALTLVIVVAAASIGGTLALISRDTATKPTLIVKRTETCLIGASGDDVTRCYDQGKINARAVCRAESATVIAVEVIYDEGIRFSSDSGDFDQPDSVALAQKLPFVETMTCRRLLNMEP